MLKRLTAALLSVLLVLTQTGFAAAEGDTVSDDWGSVVSFFSDAWDTVSGLASDAWSEASKAVESAWDEASGWISRAWDDSSEWVREIWGDVSSRASDAYGSVSDSVTAWWNEVFGIVTDTAQGAWNWLGQVAPLLKEDNAVTLGKILGAVSATGSGAEDRVREVFSALLEDLGVTGQDADRVWASVQAYAKENGISGLTAAKLSLPLLFRLTVGAEAGSDRSLPALAAARYLTGSLESITAGQASAEELLRQLKEVLAGI